MLEKICIGNFYVMIKKKDMKFIDPFTAENLKWLFLSISFNICYILNRTHIQPKYHFIQQEKALSLNVGMLSWWFRKK